MASDELNALMQFTMTKGASPIGGESQSVIGTGDELATTNSTRWTQGEYFEVKDFDFELSIESSIEGDKESDVNKMRHELDELRRQVVQLTEKLKDPGQSGKSAAKSGSGGGGGGGTFEEYTSGTDTTVPGYKRRVEKFRFKKQMDAASTVLIKACYDRKPFASAVLIKRKDAGAGSGGTGSQTYVRFDFTEPLITEVSLDVDDVVQEEVKFVARAITITYAKQNANGSMATQPAVTITLNTTQED